MARVAAVAIKIMRAMAAPAHQESLWPMLFKHPFRWCHSRFNKMYSPEFVHSSRLWCGAWRFHRGLCQVASDDQAVASIGDVSKLCGEGRLDEALQAVEVMDQQGIPLPRDIAYCLLQGCTKQEDLAVARRLHSLMVRSGLDSITVFGDHLIRLFTSCGDLLEASQVFCKVAKPSVYTWTAIISAHAKLGQGERALELYHKMQQSGVKSDDYVYVAVLKACANTSALTQGRLIHAQIIESGFDSNVFVGSTLVDMYAKCGSLEEARKVFDKMPNRNVVSWCAMIAGYAQYGNCKLARQCLEEMQRQGLKPNDTTFKSILAACSHAGLVDEGCRYFKSMKEDYGITPSIEHYTCMVDLLGRAGRLNEAENLLKTMPIPPDAIGWRSLLTACRTYGNMELGRRCFDQVVQLDPNDASGYVLMSNIYADVHMWEEVDKIQELRKGACAWKKPGRAWIEVNNKVHEFIVRDKRHPQSDEIYAKLKMLSGLMKKEGYVPQLDLVLQPVSDEDKEDALCGHCEKLAIAFGLVSTPGGTTIQVTKNLRVCIDCHNGTKIISKIEKRDIIIRDAYRVHHFKDGACTCGDYY